MVHAPSLCTVVDFFLERPLNPTPQLVLPPKNIVNVFWRKNQYFEQFPLCVGPFGLGKKWFSSSELLNLSFP